MVWADSLELLLELFFVAVLSIVPPFPPHQADVHNTNITTLVQGLAALAHQIRRRFLEMGSFGKGLVDKTTASASSSIILK